MKTRHLQHLYLRAGFGLGFNTLNKLKSKSKIEIVFNLFLDVNKTRPLEIDLSGLNFF
jgi:hypothetical protein